ncbi:cobalt transporter [Nocardia sp. 852002-20019_SCH5090214]|uniref:CbtA family protein n=1 Tax=Nocardia sp. 852002-20019_SCH5090214 TaxID=1834087 RepID=UPI0007EBD3BE|nr:CbtA family protein [Nocardia sp. 852002-20019_SCH5090214]OBA60642.1 cobalt transporter [Nocardia sp. 852002-20019_SCH5090214]
MEKRIIARGVLVGATGGLAAFVFARILAEPIIDRAIDYEGGRDAAHTTLEAAAGHSMAGMEESELFTRSVQSTIGLGFGTVVFGAAMGALFAVVYCLFMGRVGSLSPRNLALCVAGGMFGVLYAVPFLKYPTNPPSIGNPDTIGQRTGLYLSMVVIAAVCAVGAVWLGRKLQARLGNWTATIAAGLAFVVVVTAIAALLPALGHLAANRAPGDAATETPGPLTDSSGRIVYPGFPADDLYYFRFYSLAAQVILWSVIGVGFATLAPRLFRRADESAAAAPAAAV